MDLSPSLISALENIYISPLELCNLNCRLCYTNKTKSILTNDQILSFVEKYKLALDNFEERFLTSIQRGNTLAARKKMFKKLSASPALKSILFCGGEVFTLPDFPALVNGLLAQNIFISIITNGTIDRLGEIDDPKNCQLLVSFDGPREVHDANRGTGMFDRSLKFVDHALSLGFPVEIMFLVTPDSYPFIDSFPSCLSKALKLSYITQKTKFFTSNHNLTNQQSSAGLAPDQIINIKKHYSSIPPKNFGCFQLSLQSNGNLYGCCETPNSLGKMTENLNIIIHKFIASLNTCSTCGQCSGCTSPEFFCGYKKELRLLTCQEVAKTFNSS